MATKNDKLVLNTIFNPFEPNLDLDDDEQPNDGVCPVHQNGPERSDYPLDKLKQIEVEGIKLAEEGEPISTTSFVVQTFHPNFV